MAKATFEELKEKQEKHWALVQSVRRAELEELHKDLSQRPDVKNSPHGKLWNDCGVSCFSCLKQTMFHVERWVVVNGVRHRAELTCADCNKTATYDFGASKWLICE